MLASLFPTRSDGCGVGGDRCRDLACGRCRGHRPTRHDRREWPQLQVTEVAWPTNSPPPPSWSWESPPVFPLRSWRGVDVTVAPGVIESEPNPLIRRPTKTSSASCRYDSVRKKSTTVAMPFDVQAAKADVDAGAARTRAERASRPRSGVYIGSVGIPRRFYRAVEIAIDRSRYPCRCSTAARRVAIDRLLAGTLPTTSSTQGVVASLGPVAVDGARPHLRAVFVKIATTPAHRDGSVGDHRYRQRQRELNSSSCRVAIRDEIVADRSATP